MKKWTLVQFTETITFFSSPGAKQMLCILIVLYYHLPPLSPTTTNKKGQKKRRKETEINFQSGVRQIEAMYDSETRVMANEFQQWQLREWTTWVKYFVATLFWFFKKQQQESED